MTSKAVSKRADGIAWFAAGAAFATAVLLARRILKRKQKQHRPRFVLFGNSITQYSFQPAGFGASIAHLYQRHADIVNRGFSGYNTDVNAFSVLCG